MNAELFDLWIEKLEDGSYQQGSGALKRVTSKGEFHCCLGVLCDISGAGHWEDGLSEAQVYVVGDEPSSGALPSRFARKLNLHADGSPSIISQFMDKYGTPMGMNDAGVSFKDIAAALKEFRQEFVEE